MLFVISISFGQIKKSHFPEKPQNNILIQILLLVINGKTVYRGYAQLESHFEAVKKNIRGQIKFPFLEIIGVNDRLIVRFDENISDNHGRQYPGNVIAIFTLRNGKIWKWDEVVNSAYFFQPDSQTVVYSK